MSDVTGFDLVQSKYWIKSDRPDIVQFLFTLEKKLSNFVFFSMKVIILSVLEIDLDK